MNHTWPGNVRELRNVIERTFALGDDPTHITPEDLPAEIRRATGIETGFTGFREAVREAGEGLAFEIKFGSLGDGFPTYDQLVAEHIRLALVKTKGVKSRAANLLSIDRNRLYRLMSKYQIEVDGFRPN